MVRFSERTILVTGASGGVGAAIARSLGEEGATVCLSGRNLERLETVAAQLPDQRGRCYPGDLAVEKETDEVVRRMLAENSRLDGVIHGAAIIALAPVATGLTEDFENQFKTNVLAPYRLSQLLLPALTASRGQLIFLNSSSGLVARAEVSQYAATKHALKAVADSLREECNSAGVRVCSLFLGAIATPMQEAVRAYQNRAYHPESLIQPEDIAGMVSALLALPPTSEVTDVTMRPTAKS